MHSFIRGTVYEECNEYVRLFLSPKKPKELENRLLYYLIILFILIFLLIFMKIIRDLFSIIPIFRLKFGDDESNSKVKKIIIKSNYKSIRYEMPGLADLQNNLVENVLKKPLIDSNKNETQSIESFKSKIKMAELKADFKRIAEHIRSIIKNGFRQFDTSLEGRNLHIKIDKTILSKLVLSLFELSKKIIFNYIFKLNQIDKKYLKLTHVNHKFNKLAGLKQTQLLTEYAMTKIKNKETNIMTKDQPDSDYRISTELNENEHIFEFSHLDCTQHGINCNHCHACGQLTNF